MLLFNSECHFEVLPTYCFYFNCNKSRSKTYELEINRKKSHGSWKHKNKMSLAMEQPRLKVQETRNAREHIEYEPSEARRNARQGARKARGM